MTSARARIVGGVLLIVIAVLGSMTRSYAQAETGEFDVLSVDVSGHPEVVATVAAPRTLTGIDLSADAEAFTVSEAGVVLESLVSPVPNENLEVVLAIDTSGSMSGAPIDAARAAARSFVGLLPPTARIALVGVGPVPGPVVGFTTDTAAILTAIDGLSTGGETALYDGLVTAIDQFDPASQARRFALVLSDGGNTVGSATLEDVTTRLASSNIEVSVVSLATSESDPSALEAISGASGGRVVAANDPASLGEVFDGIAAQLVNRYELRFTSGSFGSTPLTIMVQRDATVAEVELVVDYPDVGSGSAAPGLGAEADNSVADDDGAIVAGTVEPPEPAEPRVVRGGGGMFLWFGAIIIFLALFVTAALLFVAAQPKRRLEEAIALSDRQRSRFGLMTSEATVWIDRRLEQQGRSRGLNALLERAAIDLRGGEFVLLVSCIAFSVCVLLWWAFHPVLGILGLAAVPPAAVIFARGRAGRRADLFSEQLGNTLQLLAGGLRAGYGLMQAVDSVSKESLPPTSVEFRRAMIEVQLGRDLTHALESMAARIGNEDFDWVVRAIDIHREVGGNLAEVLENVAGTIRDRQRAIRQVRSLSAEGRMSAYALTALPFIMALLLSVLNPSYMGELFGSVIGWALLAFGAVLLLIGTWWMRIMVRPRF